MQLTAREIGLCIVAAGVLALVFIGSLYAMVGAGYQPVADVPRVTPQPTPMPDYTHPGNRGQFVPIIIQGR